MILINTSSLHILQTIQNEVYFHNVSVKMTKFYTSAFVKMLRSTGDEKLQSPTTLFYEK